MEQWEKQLLGRLLTKHEVEMTLSDAVSEQEWPIIFEKLKRIEGIKPTSAGFCCQRCNNQDAQFFERIPHTQRVYCVNCLNLGRVAQGDNLYAYDGAIQTRICENPLTWQGTLSLEQKRASLDLVNSLDSGKPYLIHAVTGAGKTEMIFPVIAEVLKKGGRVGIATPRIDVCLELYPRLQQAFERSDVLLIYGGSDERYRYCDILICTTHQLLRFQHAFDLLIVDEVDAFPFAKNDSLHFAVERAVKQTSGQLIFLTATPDDTLEKQLQANAIGVTILPARFHGYPLVEPQFIWGGNWKNAIKNNQFQAKVFRLLRRFLQIEGAKLIFMPDIQLAEQLLCQIKRLLPQLNIACVHSKDSDRKAKVQQLRDRQLECLITTMILERGVTFENCHVCIVGAEDATYTTSALVQMSGRVGRKPNFPTGTLWYVHFGKSRAMQQAKKQIQTMNHLARERGLLHEC